MSDFYLSVDLRQISGADDAEPGVIFRDDNYNYTYYTFTISPKQKAYALSRWYNDKWKYLVNWTSTSAIVPDGWNKIEVEAVGPNFTFWINGYLVAEAQDDTLPNGKAGLALGFFNLGHEGVFEFYNFEIRVP